MNEEQQTNAEQATQEVTQENVQEATQEQAEATIAGGSATASEAEKPQEAPVPQEIAYDFKSIIEENEGFQFDEAKQTEFSEILKGSGMSNEKAGEVVKYGMKLVQDIVNQIEQARLAQVSKWGEEAKTALGANFDQSVALVGVAVEHLEREFPGIRAALNETGAGNRIEIIRAFERMGKLLQEDPGMASQAAAQQVNDLSKTLYPKTDFSRYV